MMSNLAESNVSELPRDKLLRCGAAALADHELLAVILGSGSVQNDVLSLAKKVVPRVDRYNTTITVDGLSNIPGLGLAKRAQIIAALEFSRRRIAIDGQRIREAKDIIPVISHLVDRKQETLVCISLNGAHEIIASRIVTIGLVNLCQVHPREVFADPITDRACAVIVAHNHPSGDLTPSAEDHSVTERLSQAAAILGLKLLDHIIFSKRGIFSITSGASFTTGRLEGLRLQEGG